jgi:hypothetical protein
VDAAENASGAPERGPCPLTGMAMDLASAIPLIIPGPCVGAVAHGGVGRVAAVLALPAVGVERRAPNGDVLRHQVAAGPCGRVVADPQALRARVS